jgi:hypothetical protein
MCVQENEAPLRETAIYHNGGRIVEQQKMLAFNIHVDFDPECPADLREAKRVIAQRQYIMDAIRRMMQTTEYRDGLRDASLGMPFAGAMEEVGDPPLHAKMQEGYNRHKYGSIQPVRGEVCSKTFLQLMEKYGVVVDGRNTGVSFQFNKAYIYWDESVPVGHIRWKYRDSVRGAC